MRIVVVLLVALLAGRAYADRNPDVAKRLFSEGRVLYDQGKYLEACVLFEKSYQLDPAVGTQLNLAECAERDNKPRTAWLMWISAAEEFERDDDKRSTFARKRADALASKLATVVVKLAKPKQKGLAIQIGGRDVTPASEIVERLDPGSIVVTATAPGREPFETTVTAELAGKIVVDIPGLKKIGQREEEPEPEPVAESGRRSPWWIGAIASGAVTLLATGGYVYSASRIRGVESDLDDAQAAPVRDFQRINALNEEGFTWQTRTRIALGFALGGAVATAIFVVKARRDQRARPTTALQLSPVLAPRVAGAQLSLSW